MNLLCVVLFLPLAVIAKCNEFHGHVNNDPPPYLFSNPQHGLFPSHHRDYFESDYTPRIVPFNFYRDARPQLRPNSPVRTIGLLPYIIHYVQNQYVDKIGGYSQQNEGNENSDDFNEPPPKNFGPPKALASIKSTVQEILNSIKGIIRPMLIMFFVFIMFRILRPGNKKVELATVVPGDVTAMH